MSWNDILGHQRPLELFRRAAKRGRLASTYFFVGPHGIGKKKFALKLAQSLLCEGSDTSQLEPCQSCPACQQVAALTHPDLLLVSKPKDKNEIPVELFMGDREHRGQEGLCRDIQLTPFRGGRKVAIIDDADHLNDEGRNCLLKTLEEPPLDSILILIGTSVYRQLPTIVSRSQIVRFEPLTNEQVEEILRRREFGDEEVPISQMAAWSHGSVQTALEFGNPDFFRMRQRLLGQLSLREPAEYGFFKELQKFIEDASPDAAQRRQVARAIADECIEFFATIIREAFVPDSQTSGSSAATNPTVKEFSIQTIANSRTDRLSLAKMAGNAIHRTETFKFHVSANANLPNILPSWLIDLGKIFREEYVAT